jgi:putative ABC transport system permease protein
VGSPPSCGSSASAAIVAGIVGISNIMFIVVKERTREIGIRKALGATPANVTGQVMLEAVFVTQWRATSGWCAELACWKGLSKAIPGNEMFRNPTVDIEVALYATHRAHHQWRIGRIDTRTARGGDTSH